MVIKIIILVACVLELSHFSENWNCQTLFDSYHYSV